MLKERDAAESGNPKGAPMNRVLVYLSPDPEAVIRQRRDRLRKALSHIGELTDGIVEVFVTPDCVAMFSVGQALRDDCGGMEIPSVEGAESVVASELRRFSSQCLEAASKLEGGVE